MSKATEISRARARQIVNRHTPAFYEFLRILEHRKREQEKGDARAYDDEIMRLRREVHSLRQQLGEAVSDKVDESGGPYGDEIIRLRKEVRSLRERMAN
jgi:hypothetical protein